MMRQQISLVVEAQKSSGETWRHGKSERCRKPLGFRSLFTTLAVLLGLVIGCAAALAQSGVGSIQGTVTDSSGAVLVGASIHVVNQATGVASDEKTNSAGFYQVPGLFTGTYVISITAPSMKTSSQTLDLLVSQTAVVNVQLTPGAVTQQVTVNASLIQLTTTESGAVTATLDNERINELPMNGRNVSSLVAEITPGAESCIQGTACMNGAPANATEFVADGVTLRDNYQGGTYNNGVPDSGVDPDAIQEVQMEGINSSAEYSAPSTPVITTKSGTNQLHGTAFWTTRNSAFGEARSRSVPSNWSAPKDIRNEFGAAVGGPIVIPHLYHGKNKSFFFFAYERFSEPGKQIMNLSEPSSAMQGGDFSGLKNSAGVLQELYDPNTTASSANCPEPASLGSATPANTWCRTQFAGNKIPTTRESPVYKIMNLMNPPPTNSSINPLVGPNVTELYPTMTVEPQITLRLDHDFNEKNRVYLRYTENLGSFTGPHNGAEGYTLPVSSNGINIPANASNGYSGPGDLYAAALGYTHVFSPTFFSETILSLQQMPQQSIGSGSPNTDYESELGLPNNFGESGFPNIGGNGNLMMQKNGQQWGYGDSQSIEDVDENLTKIKGKHQVHFGVRYRYEGDKQHVDQQSDLVTFSGEGTALENPTTTPSSPGAYANTGNHDADAFIGSAGSYAVQFQYRYLHLHAMEFDGYVQDDYHFAHNLTISLGLRYEDHPSMWMWKGSMINFDLKNHAMVFPVSTTQLVANGVLTQAIVNGDEAVGAKFETAAQAGYNNKDLNNYPLVWGPRVGFAWQPFGNKWGTVLRGGLGRYDYIDPFRGVVPFAFKNNPLLVTYSEDYTSPDYTPQSGYQLIAPQNTSSSYDHTTTLAGGGTPVMGVNSTNAVNTGSLGTGVIQPGLTPAWYSHDYAPAYSEEVNFTVEQPMKWNSALRLSYIYTHGSNLKNVWWMNASPSQFTWEVQQAAIPPNSGAYGPYNYATGEGPYDNTTYGNGMAEEAKTGWSNYNALQVNYQKLYHSGVAWQVMYVWSKALRAGQMDAWGWSEDAVPYINFINSYQGNYAGAGPNQVTYAPYHGTFGVTPSVPPPPPAGTPNWGNYHSMVKWADYIEDAWNPPQHLQFNALVDLPFGRGKRYLGNVNKAMDEAVGGWRIAAEGHFIDAPFYPTGNNWGPTASTGTPGNSIHVYKKGMPITDCRSGICVKSYEWFNGYIPPTNVSGNVCAGSLSTTVSGLSSNWKPFSSPIDTECSAPSGGNANVDSYYGQNVVTMNGVKGQADGTVVGYNTSTSTFYNPEFSSVSPANPFAHEMLNGPLTFSSDMSLFKVFPIKEASDFRLSMDAFNVFNIQGTAVPSGGDGTVCVQAGGVGCSSANAPRKLQFTARLTW